MNLEELFSKEKMLFGKHIREIRHTRQLKQAQLQDICGIGKTRLSEIEGGKTNMTFETMVKLSIGLKATLFDIWNYEIADPKPDKANVRNKETTVINLKKQ